MRTTLGRIALATAANAADSARASLGAWVWGVTGPPPAAPTDGVPDGGGAGVSPPPDGDAGVSPDWSPRPERRAFKLSQAAAPATSDTSDTAASRRDDMANI